MREYRGIEGLRAWLAWCVVLDHVYSIAGNGIAGGAFFARLGGVAVLIFIIISGFVITHLILEKREPYFQYIVRRFFRIFPAYLIALTCSIVAFSIAGTYLTSAPAASEEYRHHFVLQWAQFNGPNRLVHILAHLTLLHGMIPNSWMSDAQFIFMPQAWSLSLEWQFYLIAPVLIALLASKKWKTFLVATLLVCAIAYKHNLFGSFALPSFFPGASLYFVVGILTRMGIQWLPTPTKFPTWLILFCGLGMVVIGPIAWPFAVWTALVSYMKTQEEAQGTLAHKAISYGLDSRFCYLAGLRSYSVYIFHWPALVTTIWLTRSIPDQPYISKFAMVLALTIGATVILAEASYRFIEVPGIKLGRTVAKTASS